MAAEGVLPNSDIIVGFNSSNLAPEVECLELHAGLESAEGALEPHTLIAA